ncbi:hypothetical protein LCGC14_2449500 [marine sediment metagenome]|uniref:Uncharacterized protein n=1 Tax=marine sediment metagenome TaxID=412755 RepID=A0A0F9DTL7_9ZZZZ
MNCYDCIHTSVCKLFIDTSKDDYWYYFKKHEDLAKNCKKFIPK